MEREAGMALDLGGAVRGHGVQDDMFRKLVGHLRVDQVEETPEPAGLVSRSQVGDHVARCDPASSAGQVVERSVEVGGAVSHVAVGLTARHVGQHWPRWRGAVECLDLGLLVHAADDGASAGSTSGSRCAVAFPAS